MFDIRPFLDGTLREVCSQWKQHSQLLTDSDFALVEPILAARSVAQHTLMSRAGDPDSTQYLSSVLTDHLMELCRLARKAGNTQVCIVCRFVCDLARAVVHKVLTVLWFLSSWQSGRSSR